MIRHGSLRRAIGAAGAALVGGGLAAGMLAFGSSAGATPSAPTLPTTSTTAPKITANAAFDPGLALEGLETSDMVTAMAPYVEQYLELCQAQDPPSEACSSIAAKWGELSAVDTKQTLTVSLDSAPTSALTVDVGLGGAAYGTAADYYFDSTLGLGETVVASVTDNTGTKVQLAFAAGQQSITLEVHTVPDEVADGTELVTATPRPSSRVKTGTIGTLSIMDQDSPVAALAGFSTLLGVSDNTEIEELLQVSEDYAVDGCVPDGSGINECESKAVGLMIASIGTNPSMDVGYGYTLGNGLTASEFDAYPSEDATALTLTPADQNSTGWVLKAFSIDPHVDGETESAEKVELGITPNPSVYQTIPGLTKAYGEIIDPA